MSSLPALETLLNGYGRVLLGYSGGVDSALLAVVGRRRLGPERFLAVIGTSASYPAVQYHAARALATQFEIPVRELETLELIDPAYRANTPDRCYFCKQELWSRLGALARTEGFDTVIDGTNADDLGDHRPGHRAGQEHRIRSPLAELGWTKAMVREMAATLGLPVSDQPAAPCLASRIRYGIEVTPARLAQVEAAEAALRALGVRGDLRVRHRGDHATVEVTPAMFELVRQHWATVETRLLALGFDRVVLEPEGYRRGALLHDLAVTRA